MTSTLHLLSQTAYWSFPKAFLYRHGLIKAFLLTDLIDKFNYHTRSNTLNDEGYFYYRREDMLKIHPVGDTTLRKLLKELEEDQLIHSVLVQNGLDRKTYFKINAQSVQLLIDEYVESLKS